MEDDWWTDHLETCPESGVGYAASITYRHNGQPTHDHDMEEQSFRIVHKLNDQKHVRLFGVFDGFEFGKRVADFASQRMVADILLDELLENAKTDDDMKRLLRHAFQSVDGGYFNSIGDLLARRMDLQMKIAGMNTYEATQKHPDVVSQIEELNQQVLGGATAVIALIVNDRLFIANAGDSRAILVKADGHGNLSVFQVSKQHDTNDEAEQLRLNSIGLSEDDIRHFGIPYCTRCIGDYRRKGGYKEIERLSKAYSEPVIADPEVQGGFPIDGSYRFLILMSSGVYLTLEESHATTEKANAAIASLVANEFSLQKSLNGVAQAVVDCIGRYHQEAFNDGKLQAPAGCQKRDDMTLLLCNFHHPLPLAGRGFVPSVSGGHLEQMPMPSRLGALRDSSELTLNASDEQTLTLSSAYSTGEDSEEHSPDALPLDEEGRIAPYISFAQYYLHPDRERVEAEIAQLLKASAGIIEEEEDPSQPS